MILYKNKSQGQGSSLDSFFFLLFTYYFILFLISREKIINLYSNSKVKMLNN
jgi:hypothetical protein